MGENVAFTERAINAAQRLSIEQPFCQALNDYLVRQGRIVWDDNHALFWCVPPSGPPQVAVWLMPVAGEFQPRKEAP